MIKDKAKTTIKTKKTRKKPKPLGPLGLTSQKVHSLAEQYRDRQTTITNLEALQNRQSQLESIANDAESLVDTVQVFRLNNNEIPLTPIIPILEKARLSVSELSDRYKKEPQSARQAIKQQINSPVKPLEETLLHLWEKITHPKPGAVTLSRILNQFPQFKKTCLEIQKICELLEKLSHTLPRNQDEYSTVLNLQEKLHRRIEQIQDAGLDSEVQRCLKKLSTGVALGELLEKPTVLEFLKDHNLVSSLIVSFKP